MEAISDRDCRNREMGARLTETHCPYCALQCGMKLSVDHRGVRVIPREFPTNRGALCQKGWTAADLLISHERLTSPLMRERRNEPLRPVSWEQALARIASAFVRIRERYGRDAIGIFGGGGLTNEKVYALGKFARAVLGTRNIDYNGRFCMSSAATAGMMALGLDRGLPFPLEDIPNAEVILLVGANPAETMPPIMQYFNEQQRRGGRLIVADPRTTATARAADLHLQLTPGSDAALANGLLHLVMAQGHLDHEFIATRTTGFEAVRRIAAAYWPERVERLTGVPARLLRKTAHMLGDCRYLMILTARGAEQQSRSVNNVLAFINLALALGKVGRKYCGWGCLTGQGNGQGGREHGQKADQLPGYRRLENPLDREHVARIWKMSPEQLPAPGRSAFELLDSIGTDNGLRALLVIGSNPVISAPDSGRIVRRLSSLDFLAVADIFLSETAELADVVLPVTQWAEEEGTMTNLEGRVIRRRQAIQPPAGARSDLQILAGLAALLGAPGVIADEPRAVFDELRRASAGGVADYAGITYERIDRQEGVFWPCPDKNHPGTPRVFLERFATADGRARFHPVEYEHPAEEPDDEYPLYLTTGRVTAHYQSGAQTRRVAALNASQPEPFVEIHPAIAHDLGIAPNELVRLATRRGAALMRARLTETLRMDTIFAPFHWGEAGCANLLTNPALDPLSRMPEFKVCAARLEKLTPAAVLPMVCSDDRS